MTENKKPGPEDDAAASPAQDSIEEFTKKSFILGNPLGPPENKNPSATPPVPPLSAEPINWKLLAQTLRKSKPVIFIAVAFALFLLSKMINTDPFGARSFVLLVLIAYMAWEIITPLRQGEKPDVGWIKILLVPTLIIGFFEARFLWQQHVATELTQEISGNPNAWVQCERFTPALFGDALTAGYYRPAQNSDRSVIQYIYCKEWSNFYYSDRDAIEDIRTLWSVGTVIHEAIHVSGELDEAVTQCLTNKAYPHVLRKLGVSEFKVKEYTARYLDGTLSMTKNYLNGQCDNHALIARVPGIFSAK